MSIFAATSDDVRPAILIAWLAGSGIAILVASLIHLFLLLFACKLARLPGVGLGRAWTTVLICDLVFYGFSSVMALGMYIGIAEDRARSVRGNYSFLQSPINFLYLFAAAVIGHALIFSPRLADQDEPAIGFGRAAAVAVVYLGLSGIVFAVAFVGYSMATAAVR